MSTLHEYHSPVQSSRFVNKDDTHNRYSFSDSNVLAVCAGSGPLTLDRPSVVTEPEHSKHKQESCVLITPDLQALDKGEVTRSKPLASTGLLAAGQRSAVLCGDLDYVCGSKPLPSSARSAAGQRSAILCFDGDQTCSTEGQRLTEYANGSSENVHNDDLCGDYMPYYSRPASVHCNDPVIQSCEVSVNYSCINEITYMCPMNQRLRPRHTIGGAESQMNVHAWNYYLHFEQNEGVRSYLRDGVENGFRIVDQDISTSYECDNYRSVLKDGAFNFIDNLIMEELSQGKFVLADRHPACVHALGAIPKHDGSFRPITDCRRPEGVSINNFMDTTFQTFNYVTMDQVAAMVSPGCYMATLDISSAYRSVAIRADNWPYQGILWPVEDSPAYLYDVRLSFGLRCAPYIFTEISDFIVHTMSRLGYPGIMNYLDDFLVFGETYEACQTAQSVLTRLLGELGFLVSWKKSTTPSKVVRYLGIIINSDTMSLSLPEDKLEKLKLELLFFRNRSRATKRQIQRLCGIIAHCAKVVKGGRTFSKRIIDLLSGLKDGNPRIRLTEEFRLDVEWWLNFAQVFNGVECIIPVNDGSGPTFATDSSLKGYGIVSSDDWQAGYFNNEEFPTDIGRCDPYHGHWLNVVVPANNINFLELVPIWLALIRFNYDWRNCHVLCMSDNTQVVSMIKAGHSINTDCMILLRRIFWICVTNNIHLTAVHISGHSNIIPDMLSRVSCNGSLSHVMAYPICCSGHAGIGC